MVAGTRPRHLYLLTLGIFRVVLALGLLRPALAALAHGCAVFDGDGLTDAC